MEKAWDAAGPITEAAILEPINPYAASKAAADMLVRQVAAAGLFTTVMRAFNHTGAGQSEQFVVPSFAAQIARIEAQLQPPVLAVGNLDEERDFLDVDDVVAAYADVLEVHERLTPGEVFNVASGRLVRIGDLLERLLSSAAVAISVLEVPERRRATSIQRIVGDSGKLRRSVGWTPKKALYDTLEEVLVYERSRLSRP